MTSITFFFIFIPILAIVLLAINLIFAPHNPYNEKDSAFECGFHSFLGQNRTQFSISFFIFALLFLLFDLEILLVYPYVVSAYVNGIYGLTIMLIFFLALTLGFAFELGKNALKIESRQSSTLDSNHTEINKVVGLKSTVGDPFFPLYQGVSFLTPLVETEIKNITCFSIETEIENITCCFPVETEIENNICCFPVIFPDSSIIWGYLNGCGFVDDVYLVILITLIGLSLIPVVLMMSGSSSNNSELDKPNSGDIKKEWELDSDEEDDYDFDENGGVSEKPFNAAQEIMRVKKEQEKKITGAKNLENKLAKAKASDDPKTKQKK